jgi:hypothetical protein
MLLLVLLLVAGVILHGCASHLLLLLLLLLLVLLSAGDDAAVEGLQCCSLLHTSAQQGSQCIKASTCCMSQGLKTWPDHQQGAPVDLLPCGT